MSQPASLTLSPKYLVKLFFKFSIIITWPNFLVMWWTVCLIIYLMMHESITWMTRILLLWMHFFLHTTVAIHRVRWILKDSLYLYCPCLKITCNQSLKHLTVLLTSDLIKKYFEQFANIRNMDMELHQLATYILLLAVSCCWLKKLLLCDIVPCRHTNTHFLS
jgi:hypothetical protein